jgi:hypothetical protein
LSKQLDEVLGLVVGENNKGDRKRFALQNGAYS